MLSGRLGVPIPAGARDCLLQTRPDRLWGPPGLQLVEGLFARGKSGRSVKSTHFYVVPRFRMSGGISLLPLYLDGVDRDTFTYLLHPLYLFCHVINTVTRCSSPPPSVASVSITQNVLLCTLHVRLTEEWKTW